MVLLSLPATAWAQQVTVLSETFESGTISSAIWNTSASQGEHADAAAWAYAGSYAGYMYSANVRSLVTQPLDLSGGNVTIAFAIRYTPLGTTDPTGGSFNRLDTADDGISVEYRLASGAWTPFAAFSHDGLLDGASIVPPLPGWYAATLTLPTAAESTATRIRWYQNGTYNNAGDRYALDSITILAGSTVHNPEPSTWALFGLATAGLSAFVVRRRRARRAAATPAA